ncbi:hypothetical protein AGABI2DRAFT_202444 [Agaricus bisporus var. bisporus H97]|uniref:hypothetical protein n=1 Tax=Agaricus bisporus var. bisporus (strain H97 / ATCC MYA-4626 / FGSC 10389) TaxID=936046 RepID=UPI00029F6196|nr:hypothetical protein AGABI2DRAFT_202444 [Agaricus bisporus var. bisporus H97]EKV48081.1 hypothetical protein AGABI2DRAFT_202444 [Agaricus bisporus var. bisporus H97]
MTTEDIEAWMVEEPSRRHEPETSHDGIVQSAVSQPLPMITEDEAMRATYLLGDFGSAQPSELHNDDTVIPILLRPPEIYLGAKWDLPADIWTFGCLVFELVTAEHLFVHERNQKFDLDETENMLYQMMLYSREDFSGAQLQASPKAPEYFNADCTLKKNPKLFGGSIQTRFDEMKIISDEDATETTRLMERCLCLDPSHRSTATELLSDPWFDGVE